MTDPLGQDYFNPSFPPTHAQGTAVNTSETGYQIGPRSACVATTAPTELNTSPTNPCTIACHIGRTGASRAAIQLPKFRIL